MRFTCSVVAAMGICLASTTAASATLFISEVLDATLPGGLPKFVEIANQTGGPVDLSDYSLGTFNNGSTTISTGFSYVLSGTLADGDAWVVSFEDGDAPGSGVFFDVYGFDADDLGPGADYNGDDAIALFLTDGTGPGGAATGDGSDATLVDVYGQIGVDGTNTFWDFTDGYSYRHADVTTGNDGVFDQISAEDEWFFSGPNRLETGDDADELSLIQGLTTPGVFPEPSAILLALISTFAVSAKDRRRLGAQ